jgi:hypothetical protein
LVSSFHSPGGKNTIFAGKYLPAPKPNETRAFYVYTYGKIQIMERCNFREIRKEIGGSEILPQAFYLTSRKAHVNFIKGTCDEMPLLPGR